MKYLALVLAGLRRKAGRTILTFLAIVAAFVLFGMLAGFNAGVKDVIANTKAERLYTINRISRGEGLPFAYLAKIESVHGVSAVTYQASFATTYRAPNERVPASAIDAETFFSIYNDLSVPKEQIDALVKTRTGAIIGKILARRYGWKIGDHVTLRSLVQANRLSAQEWQFDIVGIYDVPQRPLQANLLIMNYDYFDTARHAGNGMVDMYLLRIADSTETAAIQQKVDGLFHNSPYETRTMSEFDFARTLLNAIGDLDFIVRSIIAAVFFSLLFSTALIMMQSIRERRHELAILKTLGFSNAFVLRLILGEATMLCQAAALVGLLAARALFPVATASINFGLVGIPASVIAAGIGFSFILALATGFLPAWRGMRLEIVDALQRN